MKHQYHRQTQLEKGKIGNRFKERQWCDACTPALEFFHIRSKWNSSTVEFFFLSLEFVHKYTTVGTTLKDFTGTVQMLYALFDRFENMIYRKRERRKIRHTFGSHFIPNKNTQMLLHFHWNAMFSYTMQF